MKKYTINIYTENRVGLISRVTLIFTRRQVNIESLIASKTEIENVFKFTIVVYGEKSGLEKIIKHLEKLVEVHRAFLHEDEEIIGLQMAMYKIPSEFAKDENLTKKLTEFKAHIVIQEKDFIIIEKTGSPEDIKSLLDIMKNYKLIEFAQSGKVAIVRWSKHFHEHLINLSLKKEEEYIS